jgi:hypothetical protein
MNKLICVHCQTEFRVKSNDVYLVEMFNDPPRPYKIWSADSWECPGCGSVVLSGFSQECWEHFETDFAYHLEMIKKKEKDGHCTIVYDFEKPQNQQLHLPDQTVDIPEKNKAKT